MLDEELRDDVLSRVRCPSLSVLDEFLEVLKDKVEGAESEQAHTLVTLGPHTCTRQLYAGGLTMVQLVWQRYTTHKTVRLRRELKHGPAEGACVRSTYMPPGRQEQALALGPSALGRRTSPGGASCPRSVHPLTRGRRNP